MKKQLLTIVGMFVCVFIYAQDTQAPSSFGKINGPVSVPSLAEQLRTGTLKFASKKPQGGKPKLRYSNKVVPGKGFPKGNDPKQGSQLNAPKHRVKAPEFTFIAAQPTSIPTDPTGAAGPNHYIAAWNSSFAIFDKQGNELVPAASLGTLFDGNTLGDPIVFYDAQADRFVITEFDDNPNGFDVAVCKGPDPVNDGWWVYSAGFETGEFPDYTKFSVWGDAYYVTANINNGVGGDRLFAVERDSMLVGNNAQFIGFPLPDILTNGFYSPQAFHVTDANLPPAGTPASIVYMQDDEWAGVNDDHLKIWNVTLDWDMPSNSNISAPQIITTADFIGVFDGGSFSNRPQGGGQDIDVLQATIMNQAQYRRFPGYNAVVFNFVVDVFGGSQEKAGIRWYELRQAADGAPWEIYQEGTYEAPDGRDAYSGSMAMNGAGDIAMAYTSSSLTDRISIRYVGRFAGDPLHLMTTEEQLIAQSNAPDPIERLADYVHLTVDPADDTSFWHIAEYFEPLRQDVVAKFQLEAPDPNDIGVVAILSPTEGPLNASEPITVSIRNFGSNDITDFDVEYSINQGATVTETYEGTIPAGAIVTYTFDTPGDFTIPLPVYIIEASTSLPNDSNTNNDSSSVTVTNATIPNLCLPYSSCDFSDGLIRLTLGGEDLDLDECPLLSLGYIDNTDITFELDLDNPNNGVLQVGYEGNKYFFWIDFNDNAIFEENERVVGGEVATAATNENFVIDFSNFPNATPGPHLLRVRAGLDNDVGLGTVSDPCALLVYAKTYDFTANITQELSVNDHALKQSELQVLTQANNQFKVLLNTAYQGEAVIGVYNMGGKQIIHNLMSQNGNTYQYDLDMSFASKGVYLIKVENPYTREATTAKIIVR